MNSSEPSDIILKTIKKKRDLIKCFIANLESYGSRLTNSNIVFGGIATLLTVTPAVGGKPLMDTLIIIDPNSLAWRVLFAIAALFSLLSTITASLYKSNEIASHLSKAQVCDAKLEGLEMLLKVGYIIPEEAIIQYNQYITDISFISSIPDGRSRDIDLVNGKINTPEENQDVGIKFYCSGRVEGMTAQCHLWLAVELNGYIWPKEGEIIANDDGSWGVNVFQQGEVTNFLLSLFVVDTKTNDRFHTWIIKGNETGTYPKIRRLGETKRIDSICLHRVNVS